MNSRLDSLRISLPYRAMAYAHQPRGYTNPPFADHTPVRITGGIGDLILALGVAEELNKAVGDVKIYSKWPEIASLFSTLPQLKDEDLMVNGFDFYIGLNCVAFFKFAKNFKGFKNPALGHVYLSHLDFLTSDDDWEMFADHHPHFDGLLGDKAVKEKYTRETISYKYLGLTYPGPMKKPVVPSTIFSTWQPFKYITIHDGFDANNTNVLKDRSMKSWDLQHWKDLVKIFKDKIPHIKIVQLGGPTSRRIKGVDMDLVGVTNFRESLSLLKGSLLHIDGDSGLVHAARTLGTKSIVLFGPTNADYFGYPENINMKPKFCGNCWWLNPDWMARCQLDYQTPECMDSIEPHSVASEAIARLV